uniref:Cytochrome c biogenesis protein CcsA n=1 Tax=Sarcinofilum mucosum TaxID=141643 RepID=A0A1W6EG59_SARMC|nr:heme attachment to plastid cytochrome c [Sarcinofilum mucosum]ARK14383.1 heme attachment to plastid cytochrome c [Sarcinofilum mucosum]
MPFQIIENTLTNLNFVLLILTMLFYFLQSASLISVKWSFLANLGIQLSNFLQATFLGLRWFSSGHFPLSNLYESLLFLAWVLTTILIVVNNKLHRFTNPVQKKTLKSSNLTISSNLIDSFLGSLLTPLILLINTFATFSLPPELKLTTSLVPALKSNWLMMHVTLMILSYGALLCGCLLAIAFLMISSSTFPPVTVWGPYDFFDVFKAGTKDSPTFPNEKAKGPVSFKKESFEKTFGDASLQKISESTVFSQKLSQNLNVYTTSPSVKIENYNSDNLISSYSTPLMEEPQITKKYDNLIETLDNLSYRIIGFGFPLLTIGILSGAVWANQTWGSYWSWDPKETWALITWLIFAIYLHTRISHGWTGRQSALIACFGFIIIWICYLGVNLLGKGLHSYGFFN